MSVKRNTKSLVIVFVLIVVSLYIVARWRIGRMGNADLLKAFNKMEAQLIKIINDENQTLSFQAKIADDSDEQEAGFQYVDKTTIERTIILFVFQSEIHGEFHMRNVEASLDIAFIKTNGTITEILHMDANAPQTYGSDKQLQIRHRSPSQLLQ